MATYYIDPSSTTNGSGTIESPYNTFVGIAWAANNKYYIKRNTTLKETVTATSGSHLLFAPYGDGVFPPIIDMENTRTIGIDLSSRTFCTVEGLRFINQNSASGGAVAVTGSNHKVVNCSFYNNRVAVFINAADSCVIQNNKIDVGNKLTLNVAYGIRINNLTAYGNLLKQNIIYSTASMSYCTGIELFGGTGTVISNNVITAYNSDAIILRAGAISNKVVGNLVVGSLRDGIALENAFSNLIYNNTIYNDASIGATFPCIKIGNDFGAGSPSDNNDFKNNICFSRGEIPVANSNGGQNNTFENNCYYRLLPTGVSSVVVAYNYFSGPTSNFLTLAEWQALGNDLNSFNARPDYTSAFTLPSTSFLKAAGKTTGPYTDQLNQTYINPPSIGAYEYVSERAVR